MTLTRRESPSFSFWSAFCESHMETAVATPAPSAAPAAPSAAPSAPATSGASPTGETKRPTFAEAFANDAAPASPAGDPSASDQPAPATEAPAQTTTPAPGPIPFDRHKAILDGAYKERDTLKSQLTALEQQFNGPDGQRLRQWATAYQQNPEGWFANTVAELAAANPNLVPALRSQAARLLGSRGPADSTPSFEPDIPVYDETGKMVAQTFSADRVKALLEHAVTTALQKEVGPIKSDFEQRQQQEQIRQIEQQATQTATQQFEAAKQWPGFLTDPAKGTVDPDLVQAFQQHPEWSLDRAYIETVVPKLRAKEQAQVLDSLQTKAAASTGGVNPSGTAITTGGRVTSFHDPRLKW